MRQAHGRVDCCSLSDNAIVAAPAAGIAKKMKLSTERILTTHVGSLPRPDDLFELMLARMDGNADRRAGLRRTGA